VAGGKGVGGAGAALLLTHRFGPFELGLDGQATALISSMLGVGADAGLHFGNDLSLRLLASAGVHSYAGVGRHLLSDDPGASGTVPYLGGRLVLGYSFPTRAGTRHRPFIGLIASLDDDLARDGKSVNYTQENWIFGGSSDATSTHTIGQATIGGFVVAGVDLDLASY
jgi:hypothetical protein